MTKLTISDQAYNMLKWLNNSERYSDLRIEVDELAAVLIRNAFRDESERLDRKNEIILEVARERRHAEKN